MSTLNDNSFTLPAVYRESSAGEVEQKTLQFAFDRLLEALGTRPFRARRSKLEPQLVALQTAVERYEALAKECAEDFSIRRELEHKIVLLQADEDQLQADKDQLQADKDQLQADKNCLEAKLSAAIEWHDETAAGILSAGIERNIELALQPELGESETRRVVDLVLEKDAARSTLTEVEQAASLLDDQHRAATEENLVQLVIGGGKTRSFTFSFPLNYAIRYAKVLARVWLRNIEDRYLDVTKGTRDAKI